MTTSSAKWKEFFTVSSLVLSGTIAKLMCKFEKLDFKHPKAALNLNFLQT